MKILLTPKGLWCIILTLFVLCIIDHVRAATVCTPIGGENTICRNYDTGERHRIFKVPYGTVIQPLNPRKRKSQLAEQLEGWNPRPCELALGCTGEYR